MLLVHAVAELPIPEDPAQSPDGRRDTKRLRPVNCRAVTPSDSTPDRSTALVHRDGAPKGIWPRHAKGFSNG